VCRPAERDLGALVDGKLNKSQQYVLQVKRPNHILGKIRHSIANKLKGLSSCSQLCCNLIFSTVCSFGLLNVRRI